MQVALSLDEQSHVLYSNRCTAYLALEQYAKALEDADECVRLQPSWPKGYLRRGSVLFRMHYLERAEEALKQGLKLDTTNEALRKVRRSSPHASRPASPRPLPPRPAPRVQHAGWGGTHTPPAGWAGATREA